MGILPAVVLSWTVVALLALAGPAPPVVAQERVEGISFVDERLLIPESERFSDKSYIDAGVGLKFGVDKRLTYLAGDYDQSVVAFQEAIRGYRNKAEIWVYLARAYFYAESPERARQTLEEAAQVMPDLDERLWQPLIGSLLWEIRQRANQQQIQVDFYSPGQQELLSLFRLYLFLEDYDGARSVIEAAHRRSQDMRERSTMAAGKSRSSYIDQARQWEALAESLAQELAALGGRVPAPTGPPPVEAAPIDAPAAQAAERRRLLQLRIDFYQAQPEEFAELFDRYMQQGDRLRAAVVAQRAGEEVTRLRIAASVAATIQDQFEIEAKAQHMDSLRTGFRQRLVAGASVPAGDDAPAGAGAP